MKKYLLLLILYLLAVITGFAQSNNLPNTINGIYWSPKKDAKIEIYEKAGHYFGKTIWMAIPGKDKKNPKQVLRNRELLGLDLLTDFAFDNGAYSGGEVYDPESGKTYDCIMTLKAGQLKVRGYVGISLFGRTEYFQKIK
jgi:uncharacterized protein (DUF2147 family)